jgi:hypothetical protein
MVLAAEMKACPACGKERIRRALVEEVAGSLVELTRTQKQHNTETWSQKAAFMAGLKQYAETHGYKPGWSANKYRERYGVWPNDPRVRDVAPAPYDLDTSRWIKASAIRWSKARAAAAEKAA